MISTQTQKMMIINQSVQNSKNCLMGTIFQSNPKNNKEERTKKLVSTLNKANIDNMCLNIHILLYFTIF